MRRIAEHAVKLLEDEICEVVEHTVEHIAHALIEVMEKRGLNDA
jgi:hypothetical protein